MHSVQEISCSVLPSGFKDAVRNLTAVNCRYARRVTLRLKPGGNLKVTPRKTAGLRLDFETVFAELSAYPHNLLTCKLANLLTC